MTEDLRRAADCPLPGHAARRFFFFCGTLPKKRGKGCALGWKKARKESFTFAGADDTIAALVRPGSGTDRKRMVFRIGNCTGMFPAGLLLRRGTPRVTLPWKGTVIE